MTQLQQSNQAVAVANGQLNGGCSTLFLTGFPEHDFKNMSFALPGKALWQSACDSHDDSSSPSSTISANDKQQVLSALSNQQQQPVNIVDLVEKQQLLFKRSIDENLSASDNAIKRLRRQWSVVYFFSFLSNLCLCLSNSDNIQSHVESRTLPHWLFSLNSFLLTFILCFQIISSYMCVCVCLFDLDFVYCM